MTFGGVKVGVDPNAIVVMMPTMFAPDVMAVDPMMAVLRPMAWNPNHLVFSLPVTRAMAVVWLVTDLNVNSRRRRPCGPESQARHEERNE